MKVLAVSFAYPPLAYPRSIQVARLVSHAKLPTIMFCADEPGSRQDETIAEGAERSLDACIRVPVSRSRVDAFTDRLSYRFARKLWNRRNLVPDQYGRWKTEVVDAVTKYINDTGHRPDALVTFAQPFTDHLIGLELKSRFGLPWLAHFSDPWVDNPFSRADEATRAANLSLERRVAENADLLAFTSQETVELFCSKYPDPIRRKTRVLPQCFEPTEITQSMSEPSGKITIRYVGNFYGSRTPRPLIAGLTDLAARMPGILSDVSFELIGPGDAAEIERLTRALPNGLVNTRPSVRYRESLQLMETADGLMVIDAPAALSVFLPSKLIDYIGAGKPVIGITPEGTAAALIRELGGIAADPAEASAVSRSVEEFIVELKDRRKHTPVTPWGKPDVREQFSAERIAERYRAMLSEICI